MDAMILQLLQSASVLLNAMPLELELVLNISDMLKSLSRSKRVERIASIVSTDSVRSIVEMLARPYDDAVCRLNCEGLTTFCSSVCSLLVRSDAKQLFILICTAVCTPA